MADNFDNYSMKVQARVDLPSNKDIDAQIRKLEKSISKLKVSGQFDDTALRNLTNQLNTLKASITTANFSPTALTELTNQVNRALQNINIGNINVGNIGNQAQQVGQQIGNAISQGINQSTSSASQATSQILRDFSELNEAKRKFVDGHGLISEDDISDANRFYQTIRDAFKEFGQVTISKGEMTDGSLENLRVKIQQVNGELKTTREFMLYLNGSSSTPNMFKLADDDTIKTTERMVQHLNEAKNITNATGDEANALKQKLAEQEKYYKNIKDEINLLYSLKQKLLSADELQTAELQKQIKSTKQRITYNNQQIDKKGLRDNSLTREINDLEVAKQKQLALTSAKSQDIANTKAQTQAEKEKNNALKEQQALQAKVDKIQHSTDISDLETKYKKFGMVSEEVENNLKELKSAQEAVFKSQGTDGLGTALENYKTKLAETKASVKELTTTQVSMSQRVSQMTEMQDWMRKNKNATKLCGDKIDELIQKCRTCDAVEFNNIKSEFKELKVEAGEAGKLGNTFLGSIKEQASKFVQWFSITSVVMEGVQAIKKMTQEVIAVDSAMIELTKVSNASSNELKNYFDEAAESAKDLGATVSDVINATADWSRLGYSLPDSKKLAEIATLYKNVGDGIDIDTANQSLVSTLQGFKLDTEDAMHIIDSFNEVANNYAIDSAGIGEALQRSASSMYAAGNTLEETIGLVTAANAVVQDPDSIGTAYKTISMRIRGAKTEMEQLGLETDGMVESTATLQKEILALTGVDIMKDKNTFKSTYAILDELATKWSDLTDIQQASVTELIAGKRQGNIVSALMTNFETAREATQTAVESQGSALREQENYEKGKHICLYVQKCA